MWSSSARLRRSRPPARSSASSWRVRHDRADRRAGRLRRNHAGPRAPGLQRHGPRGGRSSRPRLRGARQPAGRQPSRRAVLEALLAPSRSAPTRTWSRPRPARPAPSRSSGRTDRSAVPPRTRCCCWPGRHAPDRHRDRGPARLRRGPRGLRGRPGARQPLVGLPSRASVRRRCRPVTSCPSVTRGCRGRSSTRCRSPSRGGRTNRSCSTWCPDRATTGSPRSGVRP